MGHRSARLTVHGRRLIVKRVRIDGMPVAHVAKAMGISRQCAQLWLDPSNARQDQAKATEYLSDPDHDVHRGIERTSTPSAQGDLRAR